MQKILLISLVFFTAGCTTVMESVRTANTQNVLIQTPLVENAECKVSDGIGRKWNVWETPGAVAIQEGHPPLVVICTKKGFKKSVLTINEKKEEILTIDGKRIDLSIFGDFPTKFPRLIPSAIKETVGFVQDPTGSISTEYPQEITVWMEPKEWESEEQMRQWAFDREVYNRGEFNSDEEFRISEEQRKAKRRAEKQIRETKFNDMIKNAKRGMVKGFKNTAKGLNPVPGIKHVLEKAVPSATNVVKKGFYQGDDVGTKERSNIRVQSEAVGSTVRKGVSGVAPGAAIDFLNKRNDIRANEIEEREKQKNEDAAQLDRSVKIYERDDSSDPQDLLEDEMNPSAGGTQKKRYQYDENGNRIAE